MDELEVQVEVSEQMFSDEIVRLEAMNAKIRKAISGALGLSVSGAPGGAEDAGAQHGQGQARNRQEGVGAMTATQISVFLENKSGRLAEVTQALAKAEVNIRALSLAETIDYGVLRLIVDKPHEAKQALAAVGFTVTETPVIAVEVPDRPGGLARNRGAC